MNDLLCSACYYTPMPWVDSIPPATPMVEKINKHTFSITYRGEEKIKGFALYVLPALVNEKRESATLLIIVIAVIKTQID